MKRLACLVIGMFMALGTGANAAPDGPVARIAFLSDTHVNFQTNGPGLAYNPRVDAAIAAVNAAKVDLVLIAGDLTNNGETRQMALFKKKVKQIKAPVIFIPGNHDVGHAGSPDKPRTITPERVRQFSRQLGPNYFVREKTGVRVIGINSCLFGTGFPEEEAQWKFLEKQLVQRHSKPTLLLEHYPLFLKAADEPANDIWNVAPEPRKRMIALLKQGAVKTVLSGHLHRPIINRLDGILFLSDGAMAFGLPRGKQAAGWMLLTVPRDGEVQFEFEKVE